jgi:hypothetical protein
VANHQKVADPRHQRVVDHHHKINLMGNLTSDLELTKFQNW